MKFKDVAHLYLGCKVRIIKVHKENPELEYFVKQDEGCYYWLSGNVLDQIKLGWIEVTPILRQLSDMTEMEKLDVIKLGTAFWDKKEEIRDVCHKANALVVVYLTSHHFDLFGLIRIYEAFDNNNHNPNPYKQP
ncbi:MAG: hypothetical protein L6Q78_11090 [Bacteroidia bacterium]|nr:hypothetical protein [Bacteroidia bacterium]